MAKSRLLPPRKNAALDELFEWSIKAQQDFWLAPRFRALLFDAEYFAERIDAQSSPDLKSRYARAAIVFSGAAIEAASNDALVAVFDLLGDQWPVEYINDPPWCHFRRLSYEKVQRLIRRGKLEQKIRYLLARTVAVAWPLLEEDFEARLRLLLKMRNRIVHLQSLWQPQRTHPVLNTKQVAYLASQAVETAREYVDHLEHTFSEMGLPIQSYRR